MSGRVLVEPRKGGTWTLTASTADGVTVRRVAGIASEEEALARARVWQDECGYRLKRVRFSADVVAGAAVVSVVLVMALGIAGGLLL